MVSTRNLTQPSTRASQRDRLLALSQASTSGTRSSRYESLSQPVSSSRESFNATASSVGSEEEGQLANSMIRYLFALDRGKQAINKARIVKNVLGGQSKQYHRVITRVKTLLSKIFGYNLIELEGNKYILVNEVVNTVPHIQPVGTEGSQRVLLFLVLTHIFMNDDCCSEASLLNFLTNMDIISENVQVHHYFGKVRRVVTEVFVAQKYLDKIENKNDTSKIEYKWGARAEHEFTRRAALEFVSEVYNGRDLKGWPLQYKAMLAQEQSAQFR